MIKLAQLFLEKEWEVFLHYFQDCSTKSQLKRWEKDAKTNKWLSNPHILYLDI